MAKGIFLAVFMIIPLVLSVMIFLLGCISDGVAEKINDLKKNSRLMNIFRKKDEKKKADFDNLEVKGFNI